MNIGRYGEGIAAAHLEKLNYLVLQRNYYTRIGEIDIIASRNNTLVFVEVKTRIGNQTGEPYEAITPRKLSTIRKVARQYLQTIKTTYISLRVDVISIVLNSSLRVISFQHFDNVDL